MRGYSKKQEESDKNYSSVNRIFGVRKSSFLEKKIPKPLFENKYNSVKPAAGKIAKRVKKTPEPRKPAMARITPNKRMSRSKQARIVKNPVL